METMETETLQTVETVETVETAETVEMVETEDCDNLKARDASASKNVVALLNTMGRWRVIDCQKQTTLIVPCGHFSSFYPCQTNPCIVTFWLRFMDFSPLCLKCRKQALIALNNKTQLLPSITCQTKKITWRRSACVLDTFRCGRRWGRAYFPPDRTIVQIFLCVKVFWGVCPDAFDQRCKNLHRSGVWVQISNFSLEFCAKRNNFPDLDKLFAVLSKSLKEAASGCQAPVAAVAED